MRHRLAVEQDLAGGRRRDAEDGERQLGAPGADQPGDAEDLAGAQRQRDVPDGVAIGDVARARGAARRSARRPSGRAGRSSGRPSSRRASVSLTSPIGSGADIGAVAQHGDAVGEREDLRKAVADIDDADAARAQAPHDRRSAAATSASASAAVGSSMIRTRAFCDSALAISTRWRLATERLPTCASTSRSWLSRSSSSCARARRASRAQSSAPHALRGAWPRKMFSATVSSGKSSSSW